MDLCTLLLLSWIAATAPSKPLKQLQMSESSTRLKLCRGVRYLIVCEVVPGVSQRCCCKGGHRMTNGRDRGIDRLITKNLHRLSKYGALTARPGYEIAGHQLTGRRAIVATVHTKKPISSLTPGEVLPDVIGGVPVDVREASSYQRLRAIDPLAAEVSQTYRRPENAEPAWPLERELPSGKLLNSPRSETQKRLQAQTKTQPASAGALTAHRQKPKLTYAPVGCPPLATVNVTARVTTAVSPEAGLATLTKFLGGTTSSLVIGMYDFTSAEILADFTKDLTGTKTLQMVLDDPAPNPTRDQTDWQTVDDLKRALPNRANIAWALTRSDHFASQWSFPYAYHIKVIVRDNNAVWLSSGNLNRSNEPDLNHPPTAEDRDWHVIVEDPGLARTFAHYLDFDYRTANSHQLPNQPEIQRAIEDAHAKRARETNPTPPREPRTAGPKSKKGGVPAAAKVFNNLSLRVTPLLTPDRLPSGQGQYLTNITKLIEGARSSIYIELQYIEASQGNGSLYDGLLQALAKQITAKKDVRLIVSANYAEKWGEKMKDEGVDLTANIHTFPNVHNKGFVIDGETVVVSSQNFSPAGISENRDAGMILESKEIAQYFGPIFDADWRASRPLVGASRPHQGGAKRKRKPPARRRRMAAPRGRR
jgi:phosphatidylserine/phosphatidylglycerophosphate/cardiolipin synthase-like enzyme